MYRMMDRMMSPYREARAAAWGRGAARTVRDAVHEELVHLPAAHGHGEVARLPPRALGEVAGLPVVGLGTQLSHPGAVEDGEDPAAL